MLAFYYVYANFIGLLQVVGPVVLDDVSHLLVAPMTTVISRLFLVGMVLLLSVFICQPSLSCA